MTKKTATKKATGKGGFTCKQKGCHVNNKVESINGNCSICGHPLPK